MLKKIIIIAVGIQNYPFKDGRGNDRYTQCITLLTYLMDFSQNTISIIKSFTHLSFCVREDVCHNCLEMTMKMLSILDKNIHPVLKCSV